MDRLDDRSGGDLLAAHRCVQIGRVTRDADSDLDGQDIALAGVQQARSRVSAPAAGGLQGAGQLGERLDGCCDFVVGRER